MAVDDPRLDPLFEEAGKLGFPVAIHVGDPRAFFEPMGAGNERAEELSLNPQWSFADRARFPPWETLFGEFCRLVARHPRTTFVGVHFGNDPEQPERVGGLLDQLPNLMIDTAARVGEIGRLPAARLREIFIAHRDRILFGTDVAISAGGLTLGAPEPYLETAGTSAQFFEAHWRFFETSARGLAQPVPIQGRWSGRRPGAAPRRARGPLPPQCGAATSPAPTSATATNPLTRRPAWVGAPRVPVVSLNVNGRRRLPT